MAYLDENGEIVNGTGDSTQDGRMLAPNAPPRTPALPGQIGPSQDLKSIGGITLHVPGAPVLFNSPINGAVYQTPTPDNGFTGYEGPRPENPDGTTMGRLGTNPQDKPAGPDFGTPDGQLAWIKSQLAGTKYANDDPNYWLRRVNETGGFTDGNTSWWADKIQSGYFGSPEQVAAEAANNGGTDQPFSYAPPNVPAYTFNPFTAPTAEEAANSPGFQATVDAANKGLLRQRAALGSLLTGGTIQDAATLDAQLGSQNYQNVYNNAANQNAMNNAGYLQQHGVALGDYEQGLQNALGIRQFNQGVDQQSFENAFNLGNQGFGQQLSLAQLGLTAAQGANAAGAGYGNSAGGLYTGIGNAGAAGTIGSGNAWSNALGNLGNFGLTYASLYGLNNKNGARA